MSYGVTISDEVSSQKSKKYINIIKNIKRIVAKHGLDDDEWAQAISSQYFLLCLAKQLNWSKKDYANLLNKCLSSFSVTYTGDYVIDNEKLLVTPDETNKIVACMQEEDKTDDYYTHSAKMQAKKIDAEQMYMNFHYGLLVRIVSSEDTNVLCAIKHKCLERLMDDDAIDTSDGWYPYRVPWITARILISLKAIDYKTYSEAQKIESIIESAITSLYQRIDEKGAYWRSGVGKWVSKWESTGLCLESLYVWDAIKEHEADIKRIINYVCSEESRSEWLTHQVSFATEEAANNTLSGVILASVILRITRKYFNEIYSELQDSIVNLFDNVTNIINKQDFGKARQYCTIPQILHYILTALEDET